jgi:hypothetical protein
MSNPIEQVRLGARVTKQPDGTHAITIQISGLKEADAVQITELLQPLVNNTVAEVLKKRGIVHGDYRPPGKPN